MISSRVVHQSHPEGPSTIQWDTAINRLATTGFQSMCVLASFWDHNHVRHVALCRPAVGLTTGCGPERPSTWILIRLSAGSSDAPFGTAQLQNTPPCTSLKSQWSSARWAACFCTTNISAARLDITTAGGSGVAVKSRLARRRPAKDIVLKALFVD
jgi:hypothetical protein